MKGSILTLKIKLQSISITAITSKTTTSMFVFNAVRQWVG